MLCRRAQPNFVSATRQMCIKSLKISIKKHKKCQSTSMARNVAKNILRFTITVSSMFCRDKEMRLDHDCCDFSYYKKETNIAGAYVLDLDNISGPQWTSKGVKLTLRCSLQFAELKPKKYRSKNRPKNCLKQSFTKLPEK